MALNIQKARERLHQKLTRKVSGNKREFPWYKGSAVCGDHIEVTVTDAEKADNTLKLTYYGHTLDIVRQSGTPPSSKDAHMQGEAEECDVPAADEEPSQEPTAIPESNAARGPQAADETKEKEEEDQDDHESE